MLSLRSAMHLRSLLVQPSRSMCLLKPSNVQMNQSRRKSEKKSDLEEVEEFLKTAKIRFLEFNQVHTETKLTRMEMLMLGGSIVFLLTFVAAYLFLYRREMGEVEVDYERFAYQPGKVDTVIEEEKKKTWKDHPLLKQV